MARTTVADVLADGLARAGAGRLVTARASDPVAIAVRAAAERRTAYPARTLPTRRWPACWRP